MNRHAAALANSLKLYVSVFSVSSPDFDKEAGYARFLPPLAPHLAGILTDNRHAARQFHEVCGIKEDRIAILRHPVTVQARFSPIPEDCNRVLWASRIDREKRPDLLMQVAGLLPEVEFHVYGRSIFGNEGLIEQMKTFSNISYCGKFSGFDTIRQLPYALYLYTSVQDGLPNVVLEAMRCGLLVVASDVGGVGEVVREDSGILVHDHDDAEAYADRIRAVLSHPVDYRDRAEAGRRHVSGNFTRSAFLDSLKQVPHYLQQDRNPIEDMEETHA